MSAVVVGGLAAKPEPQIMRAWAFIAILMLLRLWSDAATIERSRSCGAFVWGEATWGGCEVLAPSALPCPDALTNICGASLD